MAHISKNYLMNNRVREGYRTSLKFSSYPLSFMRKTTVTVTFMLLATLLSLAFSMTAIAPAHADKAYTSNESGIKTYESGNYQESADHFTEAAVERPDSPDIKFNLGTALSGKKETDEALRQLGTAAEGFNDTGKKAAAHFNAGNARFLTGDLEGAIDDYIRAVKLDQQSEDIRFNLERAVRKLKEQEKQQQQDKDSEQEQKKDEEQEDEEQESKTKNTDQQEQQDDQQQESDQQQSEDQLMTPEEAQRLLDALNDEEKKTLSLRSMKMKQEMRQGDDW